MPINSDPNQIVQPGAGRLPASTVPANALLAPSGAGTGITSVSVLFASTQVLSPWFDSTGALDIGTVSQTALTMGRVASDTEIRGSNIRIGLLGQTSTTATIQLGNAPPGGTVDTIIHGNTVAIGNDDDTTAIWIGNTVANNALIQLGFAAWGGTIATNIHGNTVGVGNDSDTTTISVGSVTDATATVQVGNASSFVGGAVATNIHGNTVGVGNDTNTSAISVGTTTANSATVTVGNTTAGTVTTALAGNTVNVGVGSTTLTMGTVATTTKAYLRGTTVFVGGDDASPTPTNATTTWVEAATTLYLGAKNASVGDADQTTTTWLRGSTVNIGVSANTGYINIGTLTNPTLANIKMGYAPSGGAVDVEIDGNTASFGSSLNTTITSVGTVMAANGIVTVGPVTATTGVETSVRGEKVYVGGDNAEVSANTYVKGVQIVVGNNTTTTVSVGSQITDGGSLFLGHSPPIGTSLNTFLRGTFINIGFDDDAQMVRIGSSPGAKADIYIGQANSGVITQIRGQTVTVGENGTTVSLQGVTLSVGTDSTTLYLGTVATTTKAYLRGTTVFVGGDDASPTPTNATTTWVEATTDLYLGAKNASTGAANQTTNTYLRGNNVFVGASTSTAQILIGTTLANNASTYVGNYDATGTNTYLRGKQVWVGSDWANPGEKVATKTTISGTDIVIGNRSEDTTIRIGELGPNGSLTTTYIEGTEGIDIGTSAAIIQRIKIGNGSRIVWLDTSSTGPNEALVLNSSEVVTGVAGVAGDVLSHNGTGWTAFAPTKVWIITSTDGSGEYVKGTAWDSRYNFARVYVCGAGGGGGGGGKGTAQTTAFPGPVFYSYAKASGGGGGGGGSWGTPRLDVVPLSDITKFYFKVPAGGTGGSGGSLPENDYDTGNPGGAGGGDTYVLVHDGSTRNYGEADGTGYKRIAQARPGNGGAGGAVAAPANTASAAGGSGGAVYGEPHDYEGAGAAGGGSQTTGAGSDGSGASYGAGGGGGGGSINDPTFSGVSPAYSLTAERYGGDGGQGGTSLFASTSGGTPSGNPGGAGGTGGGDSGPSWIRSAGGGGGGGGGATYFSGPFQTTFYLQSPGAGGVGRGGGGGGGGGAGCYVSGSSAGFNLVASDGGTGGRGSSGTVIVFLY